jgi:hypothetical protein
MRKHDISLQINVSAADLEVCKRILQRQITFWYEELDEIIITVESKKSYGKFAKDFDKNSEDLIALLEKYKSAYPKLRYHFVDYSQQRHTTLAKLFFDTTSMPEKDYRGCAFYSYLDGLAVCKNKYIIHLDSDMLIGGTPNAWLQNAVDLLNSDKTYLVVNPLAGPPAPDFDIKQSYVKKTGKYDFVFDKMSTRIFLIDMEKLSVHKTTLKKVPPTPRYIKNAIKNNFTRGYMALEDLFSVMMRQRGFVRIDTLGQDENHIAYSLHPLVKPDHYIQAIPDLLKKIDADDIPDAQRGNYNIHNDFFDFQTAQ